MARRKGKSTFQRISASGKLSRKEKRDLQRRLYADDPGLEIVHRDAAGIDIGNESHFVSVPPSRDQLPVREFGSWTADLVRMAEWLKSCGIRTVAMQSTGVYWLAVYDILEQHGLEVYLVNAKDTKNLPGRKTDVQECQWLMKLHTYGLLRNSFRPAAEIRAVRTIWRLRGRLVKDAGRSVQQMQKALTTMNVQLANAISDIGGVTGQAIIRSILAGERDPRRLAALRDKAIQASEAEIAASLEGNWQEDVLFELRQVVAAHDFALKQIAECDRELKKYMAALPRREMPRDENQSVGQQPLDKGRKKRKKKAANAPAFDLHAELIRLLGVDLTIIDGINLMTAQTVYTEVGPDVGAAFRTEQHFAAYLLLTPHRDISGGKVVHRKAPPPHSRLGAALRLAASALKESKSYLGARYRHLRSRLGPQKAIKAMARYLACLIYRMLTQGQAWVDRGAAHFEENKRQRDLAALQRKAAALGLQLMPAA
jgi:transposase